MKVPVRHSFVDLRAHRKPVRAFIADGRGNCFGYEENKTIKVAE